MTIKPGDVVTWRSAAKPGSRNVPLGVANCRVLELGESEDGRPAAKIKAMGQEIGALLSDLHIQQ